MVTVTRSTSLVTASGAQPGDRMLVASELRLHGRAEACPAAPLLAGDLRRRGLPTSIVRLETGPDSGPEAVVALLSGAETELGLAVAATGADRAVASEVVDTWLGVVGPRTVLLASPRSFCAGVDRAIEIVLRALQHRRAPVYVRKQIVHNTHVVADLERRGAVFVDELNDVPDRATVVFSAHGVSPTVREEARRRRLAVIDTTCPLVENVNDVLALEIEDVGKVSFLTQTTLAVDETAEVAEALRVRFPALRGAASEDICYATTNRQDSLLHLTADAELVLVVGSANSSNSVRLVELARRTGTRAHLIDDTADIRPEWLAGVATIGLTAGASAPPELVYEVIAALGGLGEVTVAERQTTREIVHFGLPASVRSSS